MAALVTVRPGIFSATYGGVALGVTTSEGFRLKARRSSIPINNTNLYGDTLIDGISRGIASVQVQVTLKEWNAAVQAAFWPYGAADPPTFDGTLGAIGTLDSSKAKPLVLTGASGSPANALSHGGVASATVLTASMAILSPENDMEMLFGPVETDMVLLLDLFLYDDAGTKRFFKWSAP